MTTTQNTSIQTVQPYLFFDGCCEEALEFYAKTIGSKTEALMRFKENPTPPGEGCMADVPGDKIMHASFRLGDVVIMASDGQSTGKPAFQGFSLSISVATDADAQRIFTALSEGGRIEMPLGKTFFASSFGMLTDKFGVGWMVIAGTCA